MFLLCVYFLDGLRPFHAARPRKCFSLGIYLPSASSRVFNLTICHKMVVQDQSLPSFPTSVKWGEYINDTMLTSEKFASAAGFTGPTTAGRMDSESAENSRSQNHSKIFESPIFS